MTPAAYTPRDPSTTVLYQVVADHLETFLATIDADPTAKGLPQLVKDEFLRLSPVRHLSAWLSSTGL